MLRDGAYFLCVAMSFSVRRISKLMSRTASMVYVMRARSPRALEGREREWQYKICEMMKSQKRDSKESSREGKGE